MVGRLIKSTGQIHLRLATLVRSVVNCRQWLFSVWRDVWLSSTVYKHYNTLPVCRSHVWAVFLWKCSSYGFSVMMWFNEWKKLEDSVVTLNITHSSVNMSMSQKQRSRSAGCSAWEEKRKHFIRRSCRGLDLEVINDLLVQWFHSGLKHLQGYEMDR